jgi:hypothetical protein
MIWISQIIIYYYYYYLKILWLITYDKYFIVILK